MLAKVCSLFPTAGRPARLLVKSATKREMHGLNTNSVFITEKVMACQKIVLRL